MMEHIVRGYEFFYPRFWLKAVAILLYIETFITYKGLLIKSFGDLLNIQLIDLLLAVIGALITIIISFFIHILLTLMWAHLSKSKKSNTTKEDLQYSVSLETLHDFAVLDNNVIANNLYQKEKEKENLLLITYGIALLVAINLIIGGKLYELCYNENTRDWSMTAIALFFVYIIFYSWQYNWIDKKVFVGIKVAEKIKEITYRSVICSK